MPRIGDRIQVLLSTKPKMWGKTQVRHITAKGAVVCENGIHIPKKDVATRVWRHTRGGRRGRSTTQFVRGPLDSTLTKRRFFGRYRTRVHVKSVVFSPGDPKTDYVHMVEDPAFTYCLLGYNANHVDFLVSDPDSIFWSDPKRHLDRGGNAQIRSYEMKGKAIAIPTGPYASLDMRLSECWDVLGGKYETVRDLLYGGYARIVRHFLKNHHMDTLYYCADTNGDLGLSIFRGQVGQDVMAFHNWMLKGDLNSPLSKAIERARRTGKIAFD